MTPGRLWLFLSLCTALLVHIPGYAEGPAVAVAAEVKAELPDRKSVV